MLSRRSLRQMKIVLPVALLFSGLSLCLAATATATGGLAMEGPNANKPANVKSPKKAARFGNRVLREGMNGSDVRVLRGIVRSKSLLKASPFSTSFDRPTTSAVRRFQRKTNIRRNGVVNKKTARKLVRSLPVSGASWYGTGWWGRSTACGKVLRPKMMGVAHKTLPCGSKVLIGYKGRYVMTTVVDRGPYIRGRSWDLTRAASDAIRLTSDGVGRVRSAVVKLGRR